MLTLAAKYCKLGPSRVNWYLPNSLPSESDSCFNPYCQKKKQLLCVIHQKLYKFKIQTQTLKSLGADLIWPSSESDFGKCSMVKPVTCIVLDNFNTKKPLAPMNAQHWPGLTPGYIWITIKSFS